MSRPELKAALRLRLKQSPPCSEMLRENARNHPADQSSPPSAARIRIFGLTLALALALALLSPAWLPGAPADEKVVSNLQADEILAIELRSIGCSHRRAHRFHFLGGPTPSVRIWDLESGALLGGRGLSAPEILGLDLLLRHYRSRPRGGCTTVDTVRLKLSRGTNVIQEETYVDASCAITTAHLLREADKKPSSDPEWEKVLASMRTEVNPDLLGLPELLARVVPKEKK